MTDLVIKLENIANYGRYTIIKTLINSGLGHPADHYLQLMF